MLRVLPAAPEMIEPICRLHDHPGLDATERARLRRDHQELFSSPWERFGRPPGQVLVDEGGGVRGFLGAFYGRRILGGQSRIVANLSYWMVDEACRSQGLRLLMPFLSDAELVLTSLTPSAPASGIYQKLRFRTLETAVRIVPNLPLPHRYRWGARVHSDPATFAELLSSPTRQICQDHRHCRAWHLLVTDGTQPCYVLYSLTHKRRQRMAYLHHVGEPTVFLRSLESIKLALLRRHGFLFLAADERLFGTRVPRLSVRFKLARPRVVRGEDFATGELDLAYSELVALGSFERYFY